PVSTFRVAMGATEDFLRDLQETGIQTDWLERMQHRSRLYELVRYEEYNDFDKSVFTYSKDTYQPTFES
ncbi:MAG: methylisocitrate lyase, partial [Corynebacterium sp.]|nr:methylisocitrate lyase [Corynebacterium sp.]